MRLKRIMRRACAIVIASAMALSMAACGKGGQDQNGTGGNGNQGTQSGFTYVAEFQDMKLKENADTYRLQIADGKVYYTVDEYTEDSSSTVIYIQSLEDQKELGNIRINTEGSDYVPMFTVRPDGGIVAMKIVNTTENNQEKSDAYCYLYDSSYQQVAEADIRKDVNLQDDYFYAGRILCDKDNRLYIQADEYIYLYDENLQYQGKVDLNGTYPSCSGRGADGKVYVGYADYVGNENYVMSVEYDKKELGEKHPGFLNTYNVFTPGVDGDFLVSDGTDVYEYSLASNAKTKLFSWLDCDIMGTNAGSLMKSEDGRLITWLHEYGDGQIKDSLVYLTKKKSSEVAQKKHLTIAVLYDDYETRSAAIAFNKQSSTYHVDIRSFGEDGYSEEAYANGLSALNNAITAGEGIDLVEVSNLSNLHSLAAKGVFEDLSAYLDRDGGRDAYLENLLEAGSADGKLIFIPKFFEVNTYVGKASLVGNKGGWTMEDLLKLSREYPDTKVFNWSDKDDALDVCLTFTGEEFIDQSTGKCSFDSDDFKKILEFVNSFPDEYDWDSEEEENPVEELRNDQLLLDKVYLYSIGELQIYPEMFGEAVTYIGYPTADGSIANLLRINSPELAISSKSTDKDGAWEFVNFYLNYGDAMYGNGLPSRRADLESLMKEKMTPQYATDENGEVLKDENGQPIPTLGSTWYGDWIYEFHVSTQTEMDEEYKVITEARASQGIDDQILSIIKEEAAAYFAGQKSAADVAGVIQSRVQLYVNENR